MLTTLKTGIIVFAIVSSSVAEAQTKKVNTEKSRVEWTGKKLTGSHEGTINIKDGSLTFKNGTLTDGMFTIDMKTIVVTDLKSDEGKAKLEGHLNSPDFFGTDKFETATLKFKSVMPKDKNSYNVTGDLTIKDITNTVNFILTVNGNIASTTFNIDRTKYDIKYKSKSFFDGLGDNVIYDDFTITAKLYF